ncbi:hypothetical protein C900_04667 [Fulvivirga imtechensis AK7]|uniref:DUF721 domain-containing protein n=2 Tax=Fulvivirga TaxID=396811 RepID=L8JLJ7_9BACT|nr:hypothetical protein C900_04667 [Fulvivirga imtechensis AK7]
MRKKYEENARSGERSLKSAITEMLNTYNLKRKYDAANVIASWEKLMGKTIANRTGKIFVKKQVLFVEIQSAPLKHELNMSKSKILDIFKREFGEGVVDEVIFM